jgi:hypothetical protein
VILKAQIDRASRTFRHFSLIPLMIPPTMESRVAAPSEAGLHLQTLQDLSVKYGTKFFREGAQIALGLHSED